MQTEKKSVDLVTSDSSDEDDDLRLRGTQAVEFDGNSTPAVPPSSLVEARSTTPHPKQNGGMESATGRSPGAPVPECRSFWKAGDYDVGAGTMISAASGMLEHARIHPKFLHSNATSHKWAFGAIAELIDNAVDEVHNGATFVKVDKIDIMKDKSPALLFQDDVGGMDPDGLRKCMCWVILQRRQTQLLNSVGNGEIYVKCADGNGFKTSTMRLGADVIVFSRTVHEGQLLLP